MSWVWCATVIQVAGGCSKSMTHTTTWWPERRSGKILVLEIRVSISQVMRRSKICPRRWVGPLTCCFRSAEKRKSENCLALHLNCHWCESWNHHKGGIDRVWHLYECREFWEKPFCCKAIFLGRWRLIYCNKTKNLVNRGESQIKMFEHRKNTASILRNMKPFVCNNSKSKSNLI